MNIITSNVIQISHTATDDLKFSLVQADLWFRDINIHFLTKDGRYGDTNITTSNPSITAGNGINYQDVNLRDIFFMNTTAGQNTTVFAVGNLMTNGRKKMLEID